MFICWCCYGQAAKGLLFDYILFPCKKNKKIFLASRSLPTNISLLYLEMISWTLKYFIFIDNTDWSSCHKFKNNLKIVRFAKLLFFSSDVWWVPSPFLPTIEWGLSLDFGLSSNDPIVLGRVVWSRVSTNPRLSGIKTLRLPWHLTQFNTNPTSNNTFGCWKKQ